MENCKANSLQKENATKSLLHLANYHDINRMNHCYICTIASKMQKMLKEFDHIR